MRKEDQEYHIENVRKAKRLIDNRSLVKYQIRYNELTSGTIFDVKQLEDIMGIVVGNVERKEVDWVYSDDEYHNSDDKSNNKESSKNKSASKDIKNLVGNKIGQVFDYLFGTTSSTKRFEYEQDDEFQPEPSLSIDAIIERALSNLSGSEIYFNDPVWSIDDEDELITDLLDKEARTLSPKLSREDEEKISQEICDEKDNTTTNNNTSQDNNVAAPEDNILYTGWVRVAWPDKGVTTIEHVSFLEELDG